MSFLHRAAVFVKSCNPANSPISSRRAAATRRRPSAARFSFEALERRTMFAAGDLDTTFSGDGYVQIDKLTSTPSIAAQSDGKTVVAATVQGTWQTITVSRLTTTGVPDTTFSGDGEQSVIFATDGTNRATDVVIQPDGKILVAGYTHVNGVGSDFFVFRLTAKGELDTSFSGDGKVRIDVQKWDDGGQIALQSDGKIILAGTTATQFVDEGLVGTDVALARIKSNGSLDTSFSNDGKLSVDSGGVGKDDWVSTLTITPNGKYIVGGSTIASISADWQINWFHPSGNLYRTKRIVLGGNDGLYDLRMSANGMITAVGVSVQDGRALPAVARLTSTGVYDNSFDRDGDGNGRIIMDPFPIDFEVSTMSILPSGKIMMGGEAMTSESAGFRSNMALVQFNANGTLDRTFSGDGCALYVVPSEVAALEITDMVFVGGKLVAVGTAWPKITVLRVRL